MMKEPLSRRQLFARIAPLAVAAPFAGSVPLIAAVGRTPPDEDPAVEPAEVHSSHASMIGPGVPAPGGPNDLDSLLFPPAGLPAKLGRIRRYDLTATDRDIEVAKGVTFAAWTFNGTVPGPVIRATEGDRLVVRFTNASPHPHTIHFHGIHPANMDGVFEIVPPGGAFTYDFIARPFGMHMYHCHVGPIKKHIHKGLYGALIIDPAVPRPAAQEFVMVMNGFDTDGDGTNNFYSVNGKAFFYARYPIRVKRSQTVRIYLANLTEFDLINSFHLHGDFFRYYPTGSTEHFEYTDTVMLCQGQRGIVEIDFANTGKFMFHAHQSEFTELGWMGFFDVVDE